MKDNGKNNITPYCLFFASVMACMVLPKFLMTVVMIRSGKALTVFQSIFCYYSGYAAGGVLFYAALSVSRKPLKAVKDICFGGLGLLAVRCAFPVMRDYGPLKKEALGKSATAVDIVLLVVEALIFSYLTFVWVMMIRDREDRHSTGRKLLRAFKGFKEIFLCALTYGIVNLGCGFLSDKFITGLGKSRSVTAFLVKLTVLAFIAFAALAPSVFLMRKKADRLLSDGKDSGAEDAKDFTKKRFPVAEIIYIAVALAAVVILNKIPFSKLPDRSEAVIGSFVEDVPVSFYYADKRDYLMALKSVNQTQALPSAWKAYIDGDLEASFAAYDLDRNISMSELLYYYTYVEKGSKKDKEETEQYLPDITSALKAHEGDEVWYFAYLDILSKKSRLTETEEQERKRVILYLASGNIFNCGAILPSELTRSEKKNIYKNIEENSDISESYADQLAVWEFLEFYIEHNGVDQEVAERATKLAKEYPESDEVREAVYMVINECLYNTDYNLNRFNRSYANDIVSALITAAEEDTGSFGMNELAIRVSQLFFLNYNSDNDWISGDRGWVKEKIYPIIQNFDKLFVEQLEEDKELSEKEKHEARVFCIFDMAQAMTDMDMSAELKEYLENSLETITDERVEDMLGAVAIKDADYITALPILERQYKADPNDLELTMELAIMYYRMGDLDKSLEKAVSFTEGMIAPGILDQKPQLGTDFTALIATYITGDKSVVDKNVGKHCSYSEFTEEQMEIVKKSDLFSRMLDCEYRYQFRLFAYLTEEGGTEEYRKLEKDAVKFTIDYPQLSTGYYLAGRVYGHYERGFRDDAEGRKAQKELIDLDMAVELYRKCLSFEDDQPAVWYSLALTLNRQEKYEEALEACNRVLSHMYHDSWYTDWGQDYHGWGVFGHTMNLASDLKGKLAANG